MTTDLFPGGRTLDRGAYRVENWIGGSRFTGIRIADDLKVHVTHLSRSLNHIETLRDKLAYEVDGVAKFLYVGGIDGQPQGDKNVVLVEELPAGRTLLDTKLHLSDRQRLVVAIEVATCIANAKRLGLVLAGIIPDLVFVDVAALGNIKACVAPRSPVFIATLDRGSFYEEWGTPSFARDNGVFADPAMLNPTKATFAVDVYCLGLIIAWLYDRKHPFSIAARHNQDYIYSMEEDQRDPFTGPHAIGRLLDRVLLARPDRRMSIEDVLSELCEFASSDGATSA
jgi:hypothetical protein